MIDYKKPFLGAAYYPEDWNEDQIPYDISKMKEAGITCARIGEFAWRKMEPQKGHYDFKWLHNVVNALGEAGIAVIMGTPTATPPIWLSREYPDVFLQYSNGTHSEHGGRRHCCSNNPHYLEASYKIVEAMGKEFGNDPYIIGWQLDNEIYTFNEGCVCEHCMKAYHDMLRSKYGTIENLNEQWNLNLFSQAYDSFDEIPFAANAWHNPHLRYEWFAAHYNADIDFMHRQAEILRKYTSAPIGTDMMPFNGMDYEKMTAPLDVIMFNHYNVPQNICDEIFWFDYLRTLKDRPFWNTETATTWNGSTSIGQFLKPEGYCRVNSWLPVALGGEGNMYWLWRQHWAGHELTHGSVLSPEGRPVHVFGEIQRTAVEYEKSAELVCNSKVNADIAIHFTSESWQLFAQQAVFDGNNYCGDVIAFHRGVNELGLRPDVIGAKHGLEDYRLLISPFVMTLEDSGLAERIRSFVENGGVWVAGPLTDVRNGIGAHYTDRAMGMIEDMLGITLDYSIPTDGSLLKMNWSDGDTLNGIRWVEAYSGNGEVLASITAGHSAITGKSVITRHRYGKGEVIICGTLPDAASMKKLISIAAADAGIILPEKTGTVTVIPRGDSLILCETANAPASFKLDRPMTDILTGRKYEDTVKLDAYGVYVLK